MLFLYQLLFSEPLVFKADEKSFAVLSTESKSYPLRQIYLSNTFICLIPDTDKMNDEVMDLDMESETNQSKNTGNGLQILTTMSCYIEPKTD